MHSAKTAMVIRILLLTLLLSLLSPVAYASGLSARSCEAIFSESLRAERVLPVRPAGTGVANVATTREFDPAAFEKLWRETAARFADRPEISMSEWSDQMPLDAEILKMTVRPRKAGSNTAKSRRPLRVLITGGVHGNEPLGMLTALDLVDVFSKGLDGRPVELVVLPALNFEGLVAYRRRLANGEDLNRSLDDEQASAKAARIKEAIGTEPFDLSLDLHGSKERREFFVIKQGDDKGVAERAIRVLPRNLRLKSDAGEDTGPVGVHSANGYQPGRYNLEAPGISTSINKGTLKSYVSGLGTPYAYTVEYPGQLPFAQARAKNLELALAMIREAAAQY